MKKKYKRLIPLSPVLIIIIYLIISSGIGKTSTDLAQAYADKELYKNALEKVGKNEQVKKILGEIQPMDKMTILNGEVHYSEENEKVRSTIKIKGSKGTAKLDLAAYRNEDTWIYEELKIRVLKPADKKQSIKIIEP